MFSFCCQSQYFSHCFLKNTFPFFLSFLRILECHETYMNVISFSWDGEQDFIQQQSLVMEDAGCMWFNTESLHISAAVGLTCSAYFMGSLLKICIFQYCGCLMALTNKKNSYFPHVQRVKTLSPNYFVETRANFPLLSNLIIQFSTALMWNCPQENHFSSIPNSTWLQGYILYKYSKRISHWCPLLLAQSTYSALSIVDYSFYYSLLYFVRSYYVLYFGFPARCKFSKRDYQVLKSTV